VNNVQSSGFYRMRNSEFLGLMQKLLVFAEALSVQELLSSVATFRRKVEVLEGRLNESFDVPDAHVAKRAHTERLLAYSALRHCVKGLTMVPDAQVKSVAAVYWRIIETVSDPRRANQDAVTFLLKEIVDAFRALDQANLVRYGVEFHVKAVEDCQAEYMEAARGRGEQANSRICHVTRRYRKECIEAFNVLRYFAYARAISHADEECVAFMEQCDVEIELRKSRMKARGTLAKKASAENEGSDEASANGVEAGDVAAEGDVAEESAVADESLESMGVALENIIMLNDYEGLKKGVH